MIWPVDGREGREPFGGGTSGLVVLRKNWRTTLATKDSLSELLLLMTKFLLTKAGNKLGEKLLDLL